MTRLFKPGDRVMLKSGGPVMEVLDYVLEENPLLGVYVSSQKVKCVWYDPEEGRKIGEFHQRSLRKTHGPMHIISSRKVVPLYFYQAY